MAKKISKEMISNQLLGLNSIEKEKIYMNYKELCRKKKIGSLASIEDILKNSSHLNILVDAISEFEFKKRYKYSAVFDLNTDKKNLVKAIKEIKQAKRIKLFTIKEKGIEVQKKGLALKFSYCLEGEIVTGESRDTVYTKLPVLIDFYEVNKKMIMEICIENVGLIYRKLEYNFFINRIIEVSKWFEAETKLKPIPINLYDSVNYFVKEEGETNLKVSGQRMILKAGSEATLDTGKSKDIILPILGELKELLKENQTLFNATKKTKAIKNLLEIFIEGTEEDTEFPWISLTWEDPEGRKTKRIKIKFVFSESSFTLLNHYSHSLGREGMKNATYQLLDKYCESKTTKTDEKEKVAG